MHKFMQGDYVNYQRIYNEIIKGSKIRNNVEYPERHHIIPKCMGGSDRKHNIAILTPREHFLCHWLLYKIYPNDRRLKYAFTKMLQPAYAKTHKISRIQNSIQYEIVRRCVAELARETNTGRAKTQEEIQKMLKTKEEKYAGTDYLGSWCRGKKLGSVSKNGFNYGSHNIGKEHSEETCKKQSESLKNFYKDNPHHTKGKNQEIKTCPHCGKRGGNSMLRWHFDKCKDKK